MELNARMKSEQVNETATISCSTNNRAAEKNRTNDEYFIDRGERERRSRERRGERVEATQGNEKNNVATLHPSLSEKSRYVLTARCDRTIK